MKVLTLTLKKKWFDMILSGEKTEEYREIKDYWKVRFFEQYEGKPILYEYITFKNGYSKNAPSFTCHWEGIKIGKAKSEWSDNWQGDVFIIKLGRII